MGGSKVPVLLQKEKRRSVKSDVLKVLFPDIGKITNRLLLYSRNIADVGVSGR